MADWPVHPAAEIFPPMNDAEFAALVADIRAHGLQEPVVVYDNQVLDGRHRLRACNEIGIEPEFVEWQPSGTAEAYVVSKNLHRRHLNESQRAMIAARIAKRPLGDQSGVEISTPSNDQAAQLLNVNKSTVVHAKTVLREGTPEEVAAVESGRAAVSTTAKNIRARQTKTPPPEPSPPSAYGGNRIRVPEGKTVEQFIREIMAAEKAEGLSRQDIGERFSINANSTYSEARYIVLLADRTDLHSNDAALARRALQAMNANRQVSLSYSLIAPLVERIYGSGKQRNKPDKTEARRAAAFDRAMAALTEACYCAADLEIPYLGTERLDETLAETDLALKHLRQFRNRLKEMHS